MDIFSLASKFRLLALLMGVMLFNGCGSIKPDIEEDRSRVESPAGESDIEETPVGSETEPEKKREAAASAVPSEKSLALRVQEGNMAQAADDSHLIGNIGSELGLRLFLDRIEANVGRITYGAVMAKWGKPDDLTDRGRVAIAVWRWALPGGYDKKKDETEADSQPFLYGEEVSLVFNKNNRILVGWQYGRW